MFSYLLSLMDVCGLSVYFWANIEKYHMYVNKYHNKQIDALVFSAILSHIFLALCVILMSLYHLYDAIVR